MAKLNCCDHNEEECSENMGKIGFCYSGKLKICMDYKILTLLIIMSISVVKLCFLRMYLKNHKRE